MLIHLFRHGIAIDRADAACPEEELRFLTKRGKKRAKAAARGLATLGVEPQLILSSPLTRAMQTAKIAIKALASDAELRQSENLLWDAPPMALQDELGDLTEHHSILCVGHSPHLDLFIGHMVGTPMPVTALGKAGLATLESDFGEPGDGTLTGLYQPRVLRALGRK